MNSMLRVRRRLRGEPVDRPPNFDILMAFAAHHIGEKQSRFYLDYRVLAAANIAVQQDFGLDLVQAISDPYREGVDFGVAVEFPDDGLPLRKAILLADPSDLERLSVPDPMSGGRMTDRVNAIRCLRERVGGRVPVMGWVEGALALANVLRGDTTLLTDLYDRPEWVAELLELCCGVATRFAEAQIAAGADMIGLGDAIASQVSPGMYARFALPYERRIFAACRKAGALTRLHICGDTSRIIDLMGSSGADIVDLDWMVDFGRAARAYGSDGPAVCGNFDPVAVMLEGSPECVRQAVRECVRAGGARSFSAAGCEIPDGTPGGNLAAHTETLAAMNA